jgi:hypothetical protein
VHSETDDMTGGMGYEGLAALRDFVEAGGTFITLGSATTLPVHFGMTRDITLAEPQGLFVPGSIVQGRVTRATHPIAWGYDERVPLLNRFGPYLNVPDAMGSRVILRYGRADELFLSGLVINRAALADRPAVVPCRRAVAASCCSASIRSTGTRVTACSPSCGTPSCTGTT